MINRISGRAVSTANFQSPRLQYAMAQSRRKVYDAFKALGEATVNEVIEYLRQQGEENDLDGKSTSSRTTELLGEGLLRVVARINDPISGYLARRMVAVSPEEARPMAENLTKRELQDQVADLQRKLDRETSRTSEAIDIAANALAELQMLREGRV